MDWFTFLITIHVIGTVLGVGGATFAEIFYLKAIKDGEIDPVEGSFLGTTYTVLRVGLVIIVLSGFGLLVLSSLTGLEEHLYDPKLWAKISIVVIILINAILISMRKIPMWLGSSLSFTSWYTALILGMWRGIPYSYLEIMFGYIIAVFIMAGILEYIKRVYIPSK